MAPRKKVSGMIKLQIPAGAANPAPPVGPALGQHGVNIMDFCKAYNAATESRKAILFRSRSLFMKIDHSTLCSRPHRHPA